MKIHILSVKKKRMAMLDILILAQRRNEIDDCGIREEVDTFIFGVRKSRFHLHFGRCVRKIF